MCNYSNKQNKEFQRKYFVSEIRYAKKELSRLKGSKNSYLDQYQKDKEKAKTTKDKEFLKKRMINQMKEINHLIGRKERRISFCSKRLDELKG